MLAGNPGQRPLPEGEPQPVQDLYPQPPEHMNLNERARRIWDVLIPDLVPLGLATRIDKTVLARYCIFLDQLLLVQAQIAAAPSYTATVYEHRPMVHPQTGCFMRYEGTNEIIKERYVVKTVTIPQFHQQFKLDAALRKIESEFGMTPAARTRINVKLKEQDAGNKPRRKFSYHDRAKR